MSKDNEVLDLDDLLKEDENKTQEEFEIDLSDEELEEIEKELLSNFEEEEEETDYEEEDLV